MNALTHKPSGPLKLRDYQNAAVDAIWNGLAEKDGNVLAVLPTGCHAAGTLVLMYNGSTKKVEDVVVGDLLMGPDSKPRTVLQLARGREPMRRITPIKGDPFVVNENHILSLATTNENKKSPSSMDGTQIDNISVKMWETKAKYWKHLRKLRRVSVDFPEIAPPIFDAWAMGAMLGDGCTRHNVLSITSMDQEIADYMIEAMAKHGIGVRIETKENNKGIAYYFSGGPTAKKTLNKVTYLFRQMKIMGCDSSTKFIHDSYKFGSREVRLQVLAGLLDTDGSLGVSGFDYISKSKILTDDVVFVARSLGLQATQTECQKYSQNGNGGTYYRANISGNTDMIPTKLPRKQAKPRLQKKNPLVTGFSVEVLPEDDFYGFSLDGDHLYLTSDFIVHHNTGKALVQCEFIKRAIQSYPEVRILSLTFSKELVRQNFLEMINLWPECNAGIHSAGLNSRDVKSQVVFGSIQSIYKKALALQQVDLIIVDEAQAIPRNANTMWLKFFAEVKQINPALRIIGLTATAFRLDSGMLHKGEGAMFSHIVYEYNLIDAIKEGYLSQPISQSSQTQIDTSHVPVRGGDFVAGALDAAASDPATIAAIADEVVEKGQDRKGWILFGAGISNCTMLRDAIRERGYTCEGVFATTPNAERDAIISAFKRQEIRCLVSVVALTTGFNAVHCDLVGLARPTHSAGLYIQSCGRSTRPMYAKGYDLSTREGRLAAIAAGPKPNALILDWGGNVRRHGLLDQPQVKEKAGDGSGAMPVKICASCGADNFIAARECSTCGAEFLIVGSKINTRASTSPLLSTQVVPETCDVAAVRYAAHKKPDAPPSLRVTYQTGLIAHSEWISLQRTGYPRQKAEKWWLQRGQAPVPATVDEALARVKELKKPTQIVIRPNGKFVDILQARFA